MQERDDPALSHAMTILGRIGAIACHEHGPKADTSMLAHMASNPAEGFWLAVTGIDRRSDPADAASRVRLQHKRRAIARLARALPHPLPASASAAAQMPFWAGYCAYWHDVLDVRADTAPERSA